MTDRFPDLGATRFQARRSLGDVVSASVRFVVRHARALALGQLTIAGPALVLFLAAQALTGTAEVFAPEDPFAIDGEELLARFGSTLLLPYAALLVVSLLSYGVAYGFVSAYRQGRPDGAELWEDVRPLLWPLASVTLAAMALWVAAIVLLTALVGALGVAVSPAVAALGALGVAGGMLYLVPAWSLSYPTRVFEADGAVAAIARAVALLRGRWWQTAGTLFVTGLVGMVLSVVFVLPAAFLQALLAAGGGGSAAATGAVLSLFNLLGTMAFATLLAVTTAFLHGSLTADADDTALDDGLGRLEGDLDRLADGDAAPAPAAAPAPVAAPVPDPSRTAPDDGRFAPQADPPPDSTADVPPDPPAGPSPGGFRGGGFGS